MGIQGLSIFIFISFSDFLGTWDFPKVTPIGLLLAMQPPLARRLVCTIPQYFVSATVEIQTHNHHHSRLALVDPGQNASSMYLTLSCWVTALLNLHRESLVMSL